jgi:signal transduction histidine kinase
VALLEYPLVGCGPVAANSGGFSIPDIALDGLPIALLRVVAGVEVARRSAITATLASAATQLGDDHEECVGWAATEERNRVARELHDVLADNVSVMVIPAGASRRNLAAATGLRRAIASPKQAARLWSTCPFRALLKPGHGAYGRALRSSS